MLNILIACDHKSSRETLISILSAEPLFNIVDVCADTHAAISIASSQQPHIVFIDSSSDPLAAIEATKKIVSSSAAGVIALSHHIDEDFASHILAAGALGYLPKQSPATEIITAVFEVAKDNLYVCLETMPPVATPSLVHHLKIPYRFQSPCKGKNCRHHRFKPAGVFEACQLKASLALPIVPMLIAFGQPTYPDGARPE